MYSDIVADVYLYKPQIVPTSADVASPPRNLFLSIIATLCPSWAAEIAAAIQLNHLQ